MQQQVSRKFPKVSIHNTVFVQVCHVNLYDSNSRGNGRCLDNDSPPPPDLDFTAVSRLPGDQYNTDIQCQLALGTQYKAYYSNKDPFNVSDWSVPIK